MAMRKRDDDLVFPNAAGIDVGGSSHWVAVPRHSCDDPVREFGAMTDDLNAMADWLLVCGVDTVALESTGVYWIPVYEVLEQRGLKVSSCAPHNLADGIVETQVREINEMKRLVVGELAARR
jgi:transposase